MESHSRMVHGTLIEFPFKPYGCQLVMMDRILTVLKSRSNSLIESPTGTGKTLALLCSSLAWQQSETERIRRDDQSETNADELCGHCASLQNESLASPYFSSTQQDAKPDATWSCTCDATQSNREHSTKTKSKIFYCTRTHKQISQVVRELRRTKYRNVKMTILASRQHTCTNPELANVHGAQRNERCQEMIKYGNCSFHNKINRTSQQKMIRFRYGLNEAWDIEDFNSVCQQQSSCSYYSLRELAREADLILCPYNYLIDPQVRQSMGVELKDQVVILDEAHNIEDVSREAASTTLVESLLRDAGTELRLIYRHNQQHATAALDCQLVVDNLIELITSKTTDTTAETERGRPVHSWTGRQFIDDHLSHWRLDYDHYEDFAKAATEIIEWNDGDQSTTASEARSAAKSVQGDDGRPSHKTLLALERIVQALRFFYGNSGRNVSDFRIAITTERSPTAIIDLNKMNKLPDDTDGKWLTTRHRNNPNGLTECRSLHFWCLNPALAFGFLRDNAASLIVTSGTLSPMESFSSELDTLFGVQFSGRHVVGSQQVFVSALSCGRKDRELTCVYTETSTHGFQDEVGQIVLDICSAVPEGVLLFVASYRLLKLLRDRWKQTGCFNEMSKVKSVFWEPQRPDDGNFEDMMTSYLAASKRGKGALLVAVCRGKVSEGIDFSDYAARAVISLGIPYPNTRDPIVELKRRYNDEISSRSKSFMNGSRWYETQAFRALNQALGRCIRHKADWGAIILIDSRFNRSDSYLSGLSKWIRQYVRNFPAEPGSYERFREVLDEFVSARVREPIASLSTPDEAASPTAAVSSRLMPTLVRAETRKRLHDSALSANTSVASNVSSPFLPPFASSAVDSGASLLEKSASKKSTYDQYWSDWSVQSRCSSETSSGATQTTNANAMINRRHRGNRDQRGRLLFLPTTPADEVIEIEDQTEDQSEPGPVGLSPSSESISNNMAEPDLANNSGHSSTYLLECDSCQMKVRLTSAAASWFDSGTDDRSLPSLCRQSDIAATVRVPMDTDLLSEWQSVSLPCSSEISLNSFYDKTNGAAYAVVRCCADSVCHLETYDGSRLYVNFVLRTLLTEGVDGRARKAFWIGLSR